MQGGGDAKISLDINPNGDGLLLKDVAHRQL